MVIKETNMKLSKVAPSLSALFLLTALGSGCQHAAAAAPPQDTASGTSAPYVVPEALKLDVPAR